jgi:CheY-like chemotaxis protein
VISCLIVDDDRSFLRVARVLLEREGLRVAGVASRSADALHQVEALRPDVVLVDIFLGDESGLELTERLVGDGLSHEAPVILISAHAEAGQHDDCRVREVLANGRRGIEPFRRVRGRHPNVDDRELRIELVDELDRLGPGPGLADYFEARALEKPSQPLAEKDLVVRQHRPRGARAHTGDYGTP